MVLLLWLAVSAIGLTAVSASAADDNHFAVLLKRQAPGSPEYNCHDNCGQASILSRGADPCSSTAFVADYNACIQCAGPDNTDIWKIYGPRLSAAGAKCGLPTEPLAGVQPAVATAVPAGATSAPTGMPSTVLTTTSAGPATTTSAAGTGSGTGTTTPPAPQSTNGAALLAGDLRGVAALGVFGAGLYAAIN